MTALEYYIFMLTLCSVVAGCVIFYYWVKIMRGILDVKKNEIDGTELQ